MTLTIMYYNYFEMNYEQQFFTLGGLPGGPSDDGWSQPVGRVRPATYSVETAKLKIKTVSNTDFYNTNIYFFSSFCY